MEFSIIYHHTYTIMIHRDSSFCTKGSIWAIWGKRSNPWRMCYLTLVTE